MSDNNNPALDPRSTLQEALDWYSTFRKQALDQGVSDWQAVGLASGKAMDHVRTPAIVAKVLGGLMGAIAELAAQGINGLEAVKEQSGSGFTDLIAAGLGDLFGQKIEITPGDTSTGSGNPTAERKATGEAVFQTFIDMLGGLQEVTPEQGLANAKAFMGFGVNFAVVTAFLGVLGECVPLLHLDELKLIGEEVQGALGLRRLAHTALRPLARNLIAQPLDLYFKALLRPDRLSEGQIVNALKSGKLEDASARQMLAEKGYRDSDIELLIQDLAQKLASGELFTLVRNGDLTLDQAIAKLTDAGVDGDNAKLIFKALSEARADSQVSGILSDLESAYTDGFISQDLYNSELDKLPLSDDEADMFRRKVGLHQERPRKRISFAQLTKGVVEGIVTFDYSDAWLSAEGYSPQDQDVLAFELLQAIKAEQDKQRYKEYKANQLRAKGKPVPPWLQ